MYYAWTVGLDAWLKPDDSDDYADENRHTGGGCDASSSTLPPCFHLNLAKSGTKKMGILGIILVKRTVV
jgi:hypothetical protein